MVKESLSELLSLTSSVARLTPNGIEYRGTVEKHMLDYFESNTSPAVKDACRYAILKEFNANVEKIKSEYDGAIVLACSTLSWLVGIIQSRDAKLLETVVKVFCEDADLLNAIPDRVNEYEATCDMLIILIDRILKALGNGEITTPVSFRLDFLTNWAPTIAKLMERLERMDSWSQTFPKFQSALEKGIIEVGETLPLVEQKRIYHICKDSFTNDPTTTRGIFKWWAQKLHDAIIVHKII